MDKLNSNLSSSTASGAGNSWGTDWTRVREQEVRTEELVRFLKNLAKAGLVTRSDEMASARRVYAHLNGLSGCGLMRTELAQGCLRDRLSEKEQAELSLKTVTQSLKRIRRESWLARIEARTKLSPAQYW